jgi:CheY-like chemotaxis protein
VNDTGRGIGKQDMPHIFEEYHTTEPTPSSWHGSSGLGLPISKKLIELHSGRIGVDSVAQRGTTFWFSLPCDLRREVKSPTWQFTGKQPYWLSPDERICVVVNSDPNSFSLIQRHFQDIKVVQAADITEGLAIAEENKAIALITNMQQTLLSNSSDLLIIQCPLPDNRRIADKLGASVLLQKPVSTAELFWAIEQTHKRIQQLLIIDDDPEIVQLYQRMLYTQYSPEACRGVYSGAEALVSMKESKPDLVLLDLNMPDTDGSHVINAMTSDPNLADIPVIVITGMVQDIVPIQMAGGIHISRPNGFNLGEIARTTEAVIKSLTLGWSSLADAESPVKPIDPPA